MSNPPEELLTVLEEIRKTTETLIEAYYLRMGLEAPEGRLKRWQSRTLSALRAAGKAQARTKASIRKVKRELTAGGT